MRWLKTLLTSKVTLCKLNRTGLLDVPKTCPVIKSAVFYNVKLAYDIDAHGIIENVAVLSPQKLMAYEEVSLNNIAMHHFKECVLLHHVKAVTTTPASLEVNIKYIQVNDHEHYSGFKFDTLYAEGVKVEQLM